MRQRNPDKGFGLGFAKGATAFEIDVETGRRRGDKNIERFSGGGQGLGDRAGGGQGPVHRRREHRARVDFNDLMRARLHEFNSCLAPDIARVKSCAATPGAMRIGEVQDLIRQAGPPQGALDQIAFPSRVRRPPQAFAPRSRRNAKNSGSTARSDAGCKSKPRPTCRANHQLRRQWFHRPRHRGQDRAIWALGDALAPRAKPVDGEPRHHCETRLPVFGRNRAMACGEPAGLAAPRRRCGGPPPALRGRVPARHEASMARSPAVKLQRVLSRLR